MPQICLTSHLHGLYYTIFRVDKSITNFENLTCATGLETWTATRNPLEKPSISIIIVVTAPMQRVAWNTPAPAVAVPPLPRIATNDAVAYLRRF